MFELIANSTFVDCTSGRSPTPRVPPTDSCTAAKPFYRFVRAGKAYCGLFEYGVGAQKKRFRNREANGLRCLEVDDKLEPRGLLNRQLFRL